MTDSDRHLLQTFLHLETAREEEQDGHMVSHELHVVPGTSLSCSLPTHTALSFQFGCCTYVSVRVPHTLLNPDATNAFELEITHILLEKCHNCLACEYEGLSCEGRAPCNVNVVYPASWSSGTSRSRTCGCCVPCHMNVVCFVMRQSMIPLRCLPFHRARLWSSAFQSQISVAVLRREFAAHCNRK